MKWRLKELVDKAFEVSHAVSEGVAHRAARPITVAEKIDVQKGDTKVIAIRPIVIPLNHLSFISAYARHPLGSVIAIISDEPRELNKPRVIKQAVFHAWDSGLVEENDIVGVLNFIHAEKVIG